jgi:TonB-linked SusC/RagA family outer membrane protein
MPIYPSRSFARVFRTARGLYFLLAFCGLCGAARANAGEQASARKPISTGKPGEGTARSNAGGSADAGKSDAGKTDAGRSALTDPDKVYITVRNSSPTVQQLFALIEKQTTLYFAYDENQVDLSRKLNVKTGQQLLTGLLDLISRQTGLVFTQSKLAILVSQKIVVKQIIIPDAKPPVKGIIRDAEGRPLAGATILVKGTTTSAQTDVNGQFSLNASANDMLIVSYIGYQTREVAVNGQSTLDVKIEELSKELNEVVVMGYQTQKRSDITGAVSIVNVANVAKQPIGFADQALQGQASGVRVTQSTGQPGDGVAIRIRGIGTINDDNPLFIIDGIPTKDGINFLSANDIATITVLKDASSAAIYGARSANGVVVITTKGGKAGKAQFAYSGYAGVQTHQKLTKMCNAQEYKTLYNEAATNDNANVTNPVLLRPLITDTVKMANTDWLGAIFQTAPEQSHELSVNGGSDKAQYFVSGNYFKQDGIVLNSWYERYSLRTKLNVELSDRANMGVNVNLSYSNKNSVGSSGDGYGGNGGSVIRYALFRTPAIPIYNADGSYSDLPANSNLFGDGYNPVALAEYTDNTEKQFRMFGDIFAEYKILKNLKFKSDLGTDVFVNEDRTFDRNFGTNLRVNSPSVLTEVNTTSENLTWNNTLHYTTVLKGVHTLSFLAGTEAISNTTIAQTASDRAFPTQIPSLIFLGNGANPLARTANESEGQWAMFSLFGNVNYNYKSLYFLTANVRRDGSSRFGPDNRYGNFFSGSVGWAIHNQEWFRELLPSVSKMKLRASYGQLGNDEIGDYPFAAIVQPNYNAIFGAAPLANEGYTISQRGNPNVQWEASTQADAGLDMGIINDRLTLSVDYFVKTTTKMLVNLPLPAIGGSALPSYQNDGNVQNKGLEFELNYRNDRGRLKYSINANFTTLQNKVVALSGNVPIPGGRIDNNIFATLTAVGHPIGSFYGYQTEGIFQNTGDIFKHAHQGQNIMPGDVKYKDQNGDGVIDQNDRTFLGSAIPKFTYGLTTTFDYGPLDLSLFFQGSYGNKIYSQVDQDIEGFYRPFNITQRVYDQRWHGEGTSNTMPRVSWKGASNNILEASTRFLEDASYVRLKNLQLGYTIPARVTGRAHIKGLRFYFTSLNLLTITKFTGLDPEMHVSNNVNAEKYHGDVAAGIDWGTYPSARSYILGANLNF